MKLSERIENNEKIKIGVFMGGFSSEREISLESGRHIYNSLDPQKYEIIPIFVTTSLEFWIITEAQLWMNSTADIQNELNENCERIEYEKLSEYIEFAFLGLHGKFVEDGALQGLLELLNIPYNGPGILGSALGMDKLYQRKILKAEGFLIPNYVAVTEQDWSSQPENSISDIESSISYPIVVKPTREGCSTAVTKVINKDELKNAIDEALKWDKTCICEEFIDSMEITCTIIGNKDPIALPPTETPKKANVLTVEEKFLPGDASMITPPTGMDETTVKRVQDEFVRAYRTLNLSVYSRIDGFWNDGKLIILEPNTLPGVTPSTMVFHQAAEAGMNATQFFDKIIELSIEAFENKIGPRA